MLTVYAATATMLKRVAVEAGARLPDEAVWLDLLDPTVDEDRLVEAAIGVAVPTREEMAEIEVSSRLYVENGARYMTATLVCGADTPHPTLGNVTFILTGSRLVTVRYAEPRAITIFADRACRQESAQKPTGETVLIALLEAVVDRTADIIEKVSGDIDILSGRIFEREVSRVSRKKSYHAALKFIGRRNDLLSKARESLATLSRVSGGFLAAEVDGQKVGAEMLSHLRTLDRDIGSINDYADFLVNKTTFLLDTLVGMVSIEQNDIIKLFSVVAVAMMPPTLVASVYGMNFRHMPELDWPYGYPMALGMMIVSAILPLVFFKLKRWL